VACSSARSRPEGLRRRRRRRARTPCAPSRRLAQGDARRSLTTLEVAAEEVRARGERRITPRATWPSAAEHKTLLYDKAGEEHFNVISAFIKSMRGSDPDAAIYWLMRMLESGDDPLFLLRRMIIFASEDIGNADPRALELADRGGRGVPPPGHARGPLPDGAGDALPGERAQIERDRQRLAGGPGGGARARRAARADEAAQRGDQADEGRGLRRGLPLRPRRGGRRRRGETYLPDALAGTRFYEPTSAATRRRSPSACGRIRGDGEPQG
jgi:putative ATPase